MRSKMHFPPLYLRTYASIKLEMSESPPTPAAGPPTALDIIPDMLGAVTQ